MGAQQVFRRSLPTLRILYFALVASTLMLAAMSFMVTPQGVEPLSLPVEGILGVSALGAALFSFVLPSIVTRQPVKGEQPPPDIGPDGQPLPRPFVDPVAAARQAMVVGQTMLILQLALSEAVSCIGLVAHMLGAPRTVSLPLFAAGTLLSAIRFPTIASLVAPFERRHGASFAASGDGG
jgi:hypothetical protein